MRLTTVKTDLVTSQSHDLLVLLDKSLPTELGENTIVCITAKVVSLCEGRTVPVGQVDKDSLIKAESQYYTERSLSEHNISFTITGNTLIPTAGIDESNADGNYILWPTNPQLTANKIRVYLVNKYKLTNVGVIITDSTSRPMQRGTTGVCIAHSGFLALNNYVGKPDLFNREIKVQCSNVAQGLAAAAVAMMGEGTEQTPIVIIDDATNVDFTGTDPSAIELAEIRVSIDDDLYRPLMSKAPWQKSK